MFAELEKESKMNIAIIEWFVMKYISSSNKHGYLLTFLHICSNNKMTLRKKCPYSELFWSAFSRIQPEYPYSVGMQENADQNNSKYGHFSRSERQNKKNSFYFLISLKRETFSQERCDSQNGRLLEITSAEHLFESWDKSKWDILFSIIDMIISSHVASASLVKTYLEEQDFAVDKTSLFMDSLHFL